MMRPFFVYARVSFPALGQIIHFAATGEVRFGKRTLLFSCQSVSVAYAPAQGKAIAIRAILPGATGLKPLTYTKQTREEPAAQAPGKITGLADWERWPGAAGGPGGVFAFRAEIRGRRA